MEIILKSSHNDSLPPNISRVATFENGAHLYRSGFPQLHHVENLRNEFGIQRILYLLGVLDRDEYLGQLRSWGIDYEFFGWNTKTITLESLLYFLARINPINANTLVCCRSGADRTGMAIAATRVEMLGIRNIDVLMEEMRHHGHVQRECYKYYRPLIEELMSKTHPSEK